MATQRFYLHTDRIRANAIEAVRSAESGCVVTVSEPKRSVDQNSKFHAICSDLAKSDLTWAGKRRNLEEWKMLLVSAHSVAMNTPGEIIPGIEGEFVAIRESTARMGVRRAASLIEYALAFCADKGVELTETQKQGWAA